jgi:hypothetical protein
MVDPYTSLAAGGALLTLLAFGRGTYVRFSDGAHLPLVAGGDASSITLAPAHAAIAISKLLFKARVFACALIVL